MAAKDFLRWLYREQRLSPNEFAERLRALEELAAGKLRPIVAISAGTASRRERWNQFIAVVFAANAVRSAGRLAEGFMGQAWLAPVNDAIYFPATVLINGSLAVWLWKQAQDRNREEMLAGTSVK